MSRLSRTQERPFWPKPPGRLSSFVGLAADSAGLVRHGSGETIPVSAPILRCVQVPECLG